MSRIAKMPIVIPKDIKIILKNNKITIKGNNGELTKKIHNSTIIKITEKKLIFETKNNLKNEWVQAGTIRSIINSMIIGITKGFIKILQLVGIGFKSEIKGNLIILYLGFSHEIKYKIPSNISITCPIQNEIIIKGNDKQHVSQVAAELRSFSPPERYKGKGICYLGEKIKIKETKKK